MSQNAVNFHCSCWKNPVRCWLRPLLDASSSKVFSYCKS